MAKPTTCRKCGTPHWSTEPCPRIEYVLDDEPLTQIVVDVPYTAPPLTTPSGQVSRGTDAGLIPASGTIPKPKRDREGYNEYQRKYQANRRAENRALREAAGLAKAKP